MKTQTLKSRMWLSSLLLLPIIAILFYSFSEKEHVKKSSNESSPFLITVQKNANSIELKCESGCRWGRLILEPSSDPHIINDFGFSEGQTVETDKFTFSIQSNTKGVQLNGIKGTAWKDLVFSLRENQKQAIDQMGLTNVLSIDNSTEAEEDKKKKFITIKASNDNLFIGKKESSLITYVKDLNNITNNWTSEDFEQTTFVLKTENCSKSFLDKLNELHKNTDHFLKMVIRFR